MKSSFTSTTLKLALADSRTAQINIHLRHCIRSKNSFIMRFFTITFVVLSVCTYAGPSLAEGEDKRQGGSM
jgi:hypothetical protein